MHRHELGDVEWTRLESMLPPERSGRGRPAVLTNRTFMNAVFYIAKTGVPWRDLPNRFGAWKTVHTRFSRWNAAGVFQRVLNEFKKDADHESNMADGSYARAHQDATGGKGGPQIQAIGRSRGGNTTKIHALVDALGNPLHVHLTAGNIHDVSEAAKLVEQAQGKNFIADKGYDANHVIEAVEKKGMTAVIPSTASRKVKRTIDGHTYKERHLVENFFCKIKRYRRVATRYEKNAINFLGFVLFASIRVWLA